jgi:hypothetical protein
MEPERRTVREMALALHLGLADSEPACRARQSVTSRIPPLRAGISGQEAGANLRADHCPQRRIEMRYLHGSTTVHAASSDREALGYWTKVL